MQVRDQPDRERQQKEPAASSEHDQCWRDWQRVDDFDASLPNDRHYVFDVVTSEFRFGDGQNGDIPPAPTNDEHNTDHKPNIRIIACQIGGGARGNVRERAINRLTEPITDLEPARLVSHRKLMVLRHP